MKKVLLLFVFASFSMYADISKIGDVDNGRIIKEKDNKGNIVKIIDLNQLEDLDENQYQKLETIQVQDNIIEKKYYQFLDEETNRWIMSEEDYDNSIDMYKDNNYYNDSAIEFDENFKNVITKRYISNDSNKLDINNIELKNGTYEEYRNDKLYKKASYKDKILDGDYYLKIGDNEYKSKIVNGTGNVKMEYSQLIEEYPELSGILVNTDYYVEGMLKNSKKDGEWKIYMYDNDLHNLIDESTLYFKDNNIEKLVLDKNPNEHSDEGEYIFKDNKLVHVKYGYDDDKSVYEEEKNKDEKSGNYKFKNTTKDKLTNKLLIEYDEEYNGESFVANYIDNDTNDRIKLVIEGLFYDSNPKNVTYTLKTGTAKMYLNDKLIEELGYDNENINSYYYYDIDSKKEIKRNNMINSKDIVPYKGSLVDLKVISGSYYTISKRNVSIGQFKNGKKEGKWILTSKDDLNNESDNYELYSNGVLIESKYDDQITKYDKNNRIKYEMSNSGDEKIEMFFENNTFKGNIKYGDSLESQYICNDKYEHKSALEGCVTGVQLKSYNNKLYIKSSVENYVLNGEYISYKDGKEFYRTIIKNGNGYIKYFDKNDNLIEGKIENGLQEGLWKKTSFDEDDDELDVEEYEYVKGEKKSKKSRTNYVKYDDYKIIYFSEINENEKTLESYISDDKKSYHYKYKNDDDQFDETIIEFNKKPIKQDVEILNGLVFLSNEEILEKSIDFSKKEYIDNRLISEKNYKSGKLNGKFAVNDYNGKLLYETNFKNGTGTYKEYEYDRLVLEGKMVDGKKEGEWKSYVESSDNKKNEVDEIRIYKNGELVQLETFNKIYKSLEKYGENQSKYHQETEFFNNKEISRIEANKIIHEIYNKNKIVLSEVMEFNNNDKKIEKIDDLNFDESDTKKYTKYVNGKKLLEKNYKKQEIKTYDNESNDSSDNSDENNSEDDQYNSVYNYVLDGDYIVYDKEEKEIHRTKFINGTGLLKSFDDDRNLDTVGNILENKKDGVWKRYFDNDLILEENYKNGELQSYKKYNSKGGILAEKKGDIVSTYYLNGQLYIKEQALDFSKIYNTSINHDAKKEEKEAIKDSIVMYYDNGKIQKQEEYKDNNNQVVTKEYYYLGSLKKEIIENVNKNKQIKEYYENGVEKYTLNYKIETSSYNLNAELEDKDKNVENSDEDNTVTYVSKEYPDGKFIYNDMNGVKLYETTFVNGNGLYKVYTKNGQLLKELEYKEGNIVKTIFYIPTSKEKIELDFSSKFFDKKLQDELQEELDTVLNKDKKQNESNKNGNKENYNEKLEKETEFSVLKAFNSSNEMVLEVKYSDKGMTLNYNKQVINIKNPNIGEFDKIIDNIIKGEKVEFFYQLLGLIIDENDISFKAYYPNRVNALSVNINKQGVINMMSKAFDNSIYIEDYEESSLSLASIYSSVIEIYKNLNIDIKEHYSDGALKNVLSILPNGILQQIYYDKNGNKKYEAKGKEILIKDFYDDGTLKYEISTDELSSIFNLKLYDKNGKRLETEEFFEVDNMFYNLIHEWLK